VISPSANRGEWSELYAIGYLVTHGGGFGADEFTKLDPTIFYKILEVVDNPTGQSETIYKLHEKDVEVFQDGVAIIRIEKGEIEIRLKSFYEDLLSQTQSHAFSLQSGEQLMKILNKDKLSAISSLSADLELVLEDLQSQTISPRKGFSIKSEIGSPATIFNASRSTNLTYRLIGSGTPKPFAKKSAVKTNIRSLYNNGYELAFEKFDNPIFEKSLRNIDSNLPSYLAQLLLAYTRSSTTKMSKICDLAFPMGEPDSNLKIQKIKRFLSAATMGLTAANEWSGYPEDFGGILLVKKDGDVLFYYLYNMKKFEQYLFNNLRFDTPDATRHAFCEVYSEGDDNFIKLNFQIRY